MKAVTVIIAICITLFTGCSLTYKVSDFPSKEEFYNSFNNSAKGRDAKITYNNDSLAAYSGMLFVEENSLVAFTKTYSGEKRLSLKEVNKINYTDFKTLSGSILLNNRIVIMGEGIKTIQDSAVIFNEYKEIKIITPLSQVRKIDFEIKPIGTISGIFSGILTFFTFYSLATAGNNNGNVNTARDYFIGIPLSVLVGITVGKVTTLKSSYVFNQ